MTSYHKASVGVSRLKWVKALLCMGSHQDNPKTASAPLDVKSIVHKLHTTWLGELYLKYVSRYHAAQVLTSWIMRKCYALYRIAWIHRRSLQRQLVPLAAYVAERDILIVADAETVITPVPLGFKDHKNINLIPPHTQYTFPPIYITTICHALVSGNTNLIMTDDAVICHDLYDFTRDYTSEELNGRSYIWPAQNRIAWLMNPIPQQEISQAAGFTDACASNYAHWITEVLPRINLFCTSKVSTNVPLIINDGLHKNLIESLRMVAGIAQDIIPVPSGSSIQVEHLHVTSVTGYIPFERRTNTLKNHSHGLFSSYALLSLRDQITKNLTGNPPSDKSRIFIRRNSKIRNVSNQQEIEEKLRAEGFYIIEPEYMTFTEQVAAFSNAEIIIGATGAAFANLIFSNPLSKIIILISDYKYMPYWYWQNMAYAVGNKVTYVLGKCIGTNPHLHSNYKIEISDVLNAIDADWNTAYSRHT